MEKRFDTFNGAYTRAFAEPLGSTTHIEKRVASRLPVSAGETDAQFLAYTITINFAHFLDKLEYDPVISTHLWNPNLKSVTLNVFMVRR